MESIIWTWPAGDLVSLNNLFLFSVCVSGLMLPKVPFWHHYLHCYRYGAIQLDILERKTAALGMKISCSFILNDGLPVITGVWPPSHFTPNWSVYGIPPHRRSVIAPQFYCCCDKQLCLSGDPIQKLTKKFPKALNPSSCFPLYWGSWYKTRGLGAPHLYKIQMRWSASKSFSSPYPLRKYTYSSYHDTGSPQWVPNVSHCASGDPRYKEVRDT